MISSPSFTKPTFEYKESLSLDKLRNALIRQEETIIFALIERGQFATNPIIYKSNPGEEFAVVDGTEPIKSSFMEYFLLETEKVHARVRRYACADAARSTQHVTLHTHTQHTTHHAAHSYLPSFNTQHAYAYTSHSAVIHMYPITPQSHIVTKSLSPHQSSHIHKHLITILILSIGTPALKSMLSFPRTSLLPSSPNSTSLPSSTPTQSTSTLAS